MLVVSNRNLKEEFANSGVGGADAFGEQLNIDGPTEIRLANVSVKNNEWVVKLVKEPENMTTDNVPSRAEFQKVMGKCKKENKHCVFFVHGYNKPFEESLEQAWSIQERYGVEVVLFSWPSNTGGTPITEYKNVKRVARVSTGALDAVFEKLSKYIQMPFNRDALMECDVTINLLTYSMGNFLFQSYIEGSKYDDETRMFTNVIICQGDCDNEDHETWIDDIEVGKRIYVTINENDKILGWSDFNFQKDRLGRTARNLIAINPVYLDFTDSPGMGKTHQIWGKDTNDTVKQFFIGALTGRKGETIDNLFYDSRVNAFKVRT